MALIARGWCWVRPSWPLAICLQILRSGTDQLRLDNRDGPFSNNDPSLSIARTLAARFRSAVSNSLGITLMEIVIALTMFSYAGTAVLLGVSAAHVSSDRVKASAVAENLARNQMEYINSLAYVAPPGNYASVANDVGLKHQYSHWICRERRRAKLCRRRRVHRVDRKGGGDGHQRRAKHPGTRVAAFGAVINVTDEQNP